MESMAVTVTCRVPPTVKTTHVTQGMGHAWTVNMGFMVPPVIYRVPQTVKTTYVTLRKEHALTVNLVGLEFNVKQVRERIIDIHANLNNLILCNFYLFTNCSC